MNLFLTQRKALAYFASFLLAVAPNGCVQLPNRTSNPSFDTALRQYANKGDLTAMRNWFKDGNHQEAWESAMPMAVIAAQFSLLAYADPKTIESTLAKKGATHSKIFVVKSKVGVPLVAYIAVFGDFCVVAFKGTSSLGDWSINLDAVTVRPSEDVTRIHSGFYEAWQTLRPYIESELTRRGFANDPPRAILVTGHSLGGAVALIAGNELHHRRFPVMTIFTYGQPRVYSAGLPLVLAARTMEAYSVSRSSWPSVCRYTFMDDIVPTVPPPSLAYYHVGRRFLVTRAGAQMFLDKARYFAPSVGEHPMRNYLAAVLAGLSVQEQNKVQFALGSEDDLLDYQQVIAWVTSPNSTLKEAFGSNWSHKLMGIFRALPGPESEILHYPRGMTDQRPSADFRP